MDPSDDQLEAAVATLKLLADPTRLRIVWTLLHGSHAVNDLAEHVGANPAAVRAMKVDDQNSTNHFSLLCI